MRKFARGALVLLVIVLAGLLLLKPETIPRTGQWMARAGLESRIVSLPRGNGKIDIRYVRQGKGPTLILIHGLASSIYTWADVIGPLSESFDVIALDLPGFGGSSQPKDLSFVDLPRAVIGVMDALGVPRAHLAGNSLGGATALLLAARERDRVLNVVVLDSAGFRMRGDERPFMIRFLGTSAAGFFADRLPVRRLLTRFTLGRLIHDRSRVTEERLDEYTAPLMRPGALDGVRSLLRSPVDEGFLADLAAIESRTLVIWGRFDPWLPEADADAFVAHIKGARKVVLETGHMPQEEKPLEVVRLVRDFLLLP